MQYTMMMMADRVYGIYHDHFRDHQSVWHHTRL